MDDRFELAVRTDSGITRLTVYNAGRQTLSIVAPTTSAIWQDKASIGLTIAQACGL